VYGIRKDRLMEFEWNPHTLTNNGCYYCRPVQCRADQNIAGPNGTGEEFWEDKFVTGPDGKPDPTQYWQIPLPADTTLTSADCACRPKGGYTHTPRYIEFASLWPNASADIQDLRKVNNIIHELGHAFNNRLGKAPETAVQTAIANKVLPKKRPYGFYEAGTEGALILTWIQSPENTPSEIFADQFLGWVYGKWADNAFGRQRRDFMDDHMRNWITQAMQGGE
jgi:hypothetical protein